MKSGYSRLACAALTVTLSAGCATSVPITEYRQPDPTTDTAKLRIITNGTVTGTEHRPCLSSIGLLASAGKFKGGEPNPLHPPSPNPPTRVGMTERLAPALSQYWTGRRYSEGSYGETVSEYRVPANTPFVLQRSQITAMTGTSTGFQCPEATGVYELETGRSYEAVMGIMRHPVEEGRLVCVYAVYPLDDPITRLTGQPQPLEYTTTELRVCERPAAHNQPANR